MYAGHVMALEHGVDRGDLTLDRGDRARVRGRHADERGDVLAEQARVEQRDVVGDHPRFLELVDALDHGGSREADLLADRRQRLLAVLLQQLEDREVGRVELGEISAEFH